MTDGVNIYSGLQQSLDRLDIDAGGGQQSLAQAPAAQLLHGGGQVSVLHIQHLADQREPVGVDAGGAKSDEHVAGG